MGRDASGTEMYLGLSALSYRLVPRAGSPARPGQAALGPEKYTGRTAVGTKMYPGQAAPGTRGRDILTSNLSTLNAGILIMMQQVRLTMFSLNMVDYSMSFLLLST